MKDLIKKLEERKTKLERLQVLANQKELFIIHKLNPKFKFIYSNYGKISANQLAKKLKVNRSYIYAVIEQSLRLKTKQEIINDSYPNKK